MHKNGYQDMTYNIVHFFQMRSANTTAGSIDSFCSYKFDEVDHNLQNEWCIGKCTLHIWLSLVHSIQTESEVFQKLTK